MVMDLEYLRESPLYFFLCNSQTSFLCEGNKFPELDFNTIPIIGFKRDMDSFRHASTFSKMKTINFAKAQKSLHAFRSN